MAILLTDRLYFVRIKSAKINGQDDGFERPTCRSKKAGFLV